MSLDCMIFFSHEFVRMTLVLVHFEILLLDLTIFNKDSCQIFHDVIVHEIVWYHTIFGPHTDEISPYCYLPLPKTCLACCIDFWFEPFFLMSPFDFLEIWLMLIIPLKPGTSSIYCILFLHSGASISINFHSFLKLL